MFRGGEAFILFTWRFKKSICQRNVLLAPLNSPNRDPPLEVFLFLPFNFNILYMRSFIEELHRIIHQEICKIKDIFMKNGHSERFINKFVKTFLNKAFISKRIIQTAEKKQVTIVFPYMGMISTELKVKLHKTFKQLLPACQLRVIFNVPLRMKNYFNFEGKIMQNGSNFIIIINIIISKTNKAFIIFTSDETWSDINILSISASF